MGEIHELVYPTVDNFAAQIHTLGPEAWLYKKDLHRWFHQILVDPADVPYLGFFWDGQYYFCKNLPVGLRLSCLIAQRITSAVWFVMTKFGFWILNYIDDFPGAESNQQKAQASFDTLTEIFLSLGIQENWQKAVPPTQDLVFLGIGFRVKDMVMYLPPDKLCEVSHLLEVWQHKVEGTHKELESLIGKLQFLAKCIRPGRVLISRLLNFLKAFPKTGFQKIPDEARNDIKWWWQVLLGFKGESIIWLLDMCNTEAIHLCHGCLIGCSGRTQRS